MLILFFTVSEGQESASGVAVSVLSGDVDGRLKAGRKP